MRKTNDAEQLHAFAVSPRNYGRTYAMETLWSNRLKNQLILRIKGEIKCHIVDDMLIIDIYSVNYMVYRYTISNISGKIMGGFAVETVAESIYKGYKRYILNLYFNDIYIDKSRTPMV